MSTLAERYEKADWTAAMIRKQGNYTTLVNELDRFYSGDHSPMVGAQGYLSQVFPQSYAGGKLRLSSQPLLFRLINAAATLFHQRPGWKLLRDGQPLESTDPDAVIFKAIRKEAQLDLRCRHLQRRDILFGTVFGRPAWRNDKLRIDVLKPSAVEVLESSTDPADLDDAVAISVRTDADRREIWEKPNSQNGGVWTYGIVNEKDGSVTDSLFGDSVNGYGCYPFVAFSTYPSLTSVYATVDQTAHDQQVGANLLESWADFQFRLGFSIAVIKTAQELGRDALPISPDMLVALNPGSEEDFNRIASGLDTNQLTGYVDAKLKRYFALRGVDPDIISTDGKQMIAALTGVNEQMQRVDLQELRQDAAIPYEFALDALFQKIRAVWNWHRGDMPLSEALELEIEWLKPPVPGNELQQAQADEIRIEQGTATADEIRAQRLGKPVSDLPPGAGGERDD